MPLVQFEAAIVYSKKYLFKFLHSNFSFISNFLAATAETKKPDFLNLTISRKTSPRLSSCWTRTCTTATRPRRWKPTRADRSVDDSFLPTKSPSHQRKREKEREKDLLWDSYQMGNFFRFLEKNGCLKKLFLRFFSPDSFSSQMFRFFIKLNAMRNR